jgi:hypothetical protein
VAAGAGMGSSCLRHNHCFSAVRCSPDPPYRVCHLRSSDRETAWKSPPSLVVVGPPLPFDSAQGPRALSRGGSALAGVSPNPTRPRRSLHATSHVVQPQTVITSH